MEHQCSLLQELESKINPKIVEEIKSFFKPYEDSIKKTEGIYRLEILSMKAGSLNLRVNNDIARFFEIYQELLIREVCRKVKLQYKKEINPKFSLKDVKAIMKRNQVGKDISSVIISAINSSMLMNLSLEDCYTAFKKSSKIKSFKVNCDNGVKNRLKLANAKSAIIVMYGTYKTTLNDLKRYWDIIISKVQDQIPIGFSFNVKRKLKREKMYALIGY